MASVESKFMIELEYLSEYVNDVRRELAVHISWDGPCSDFQPRVTPVSVHCRHCAFEKSKH